MSNSTIKEQAVGDERQRALDIVALCQQAGRAEMATAMIADGWTLEEVRDRLRNHMLADMEPIGDQQLKQERPKPEALPENAKFAAEYDATPALASHMSKAEYIASRRIDEGIDTLLPEAGL